MNIDFGALFAKLVEMAPAVVVLLVLAWRQDQRIAKVLDWCLEDKANERNGMDDSSGLGRD